MNTYDDSSSNQICQFLKAIDQPARINILLTIGLGEACVCHLEAVLGLRQAYISQHLMSLREAGILQTRRDGRYIYYRLEDQRLLTLIKLSAELAGVSPGEISWKAADQEQPGCCCPNCEAETEEDQGLVSSKP